MGIIILNMGKLSLRKIQLGFRLKFITPAWFYSSLLTSFLFLMALEYKELNYHPYTHTYTIMQVYKKLVT